MTHPTTLGWTDTETGRQYVHPAGIIHAGGSERIDASLPSIYRDYALPEPTSDPQLLRDAWNNGTRPLQEALAARIIAPLLGISWGSADGSEPAAVLLAGPTCTYKTTYARIATQYFAPARTFQSGHLISGTALGSTLAALSTVIENAGGSTLVIDDITTDVDRDTARLAMIARTIHNGARRTPTTLTLPAAMPSVIMTGELPPEPGSHTDRLFTITTALHPDETSPDRATLRRLENSSARNARGLLGASLIQWIAQHRDQLLHEDDSTLAIEGLDTACAHHAVLAARGFQLMTRMLTDRGALTTEESADVQQWAHQGITTAASQG